jgi:hypothetical protein
MREGVASVPWPSRQGRQNDPERPGAKPVRAPARAAAFLLLACAGTSGAPGADPGPPPSFEHEVKASFVYTVAKFVDWPEGAFETPESPLIFGILGDDPIEDPLQRATNGKSVGGHPVVVMRVDEAKDPARCHVLFIGRSEAARVDGVIGRLGDASVLTVGEFDRFAQRGGILRLKLDENMVRFEINVDAAERAHLQISSKILKLGKVIRDRRHAAGSP